jgi:hypothetical protein
VQPSHGGIPPQQGHPATANLRGKLQALARASEAAFAGLADPLAAERVDLRRVVDSVLSP